MGKVDISILEKGFAGRAAKKNIVSMSPLFLKDSTRYKRQSEYTCENINIVNCRNDTNNNPCMTTTSRIVTTTTSTVAKTTTSTKAKTTTTTRAKTTTTTRAKNTTSTTEKTTTVAAPTTKTTTTSTEMTTTADLTEYDISFIDCLNEDTTTASTTSLTTYTTSATETPTSTAASSTASSSLKTTETKTLSTTKTLTTTKTSTTTSTVFKSSSTTSTITESKPDANVSTTMLISTTFPEAKTQTPSLKISSTKIFNASSATTSQAASTPKTTSKSSASLLDTTQTSSAEETTNALLPSSTLATLTTPTTFFQVTSANRPTISTQVPKETTKKQYLTTKLITTNAKSEPHSSQTILTTGKIEKITTKTSSSYQNELPASTAGPTELLTSIHETSEQVHDKIRTRKTSIQTSSIKNDVTSDEKSVSETLAKVKTSENEALVTKSVSLSEERDLKISSKALTTKMEADLHTSGSKAASKSLSLRSTILARQPSETERTTEKSTKLRKESTQQTSENRIKWTRKEEPSVTKGEQESTTSRKRTATPVNLEDDTSTLKLTITKDTRKETTRSELSKQEMTFSLARETSADITKKITEGTTKKDTAKKYEKTTLKLETSGEATKYRLKRTTRPETSHQLTKTTGGETEKNGFDKTTVKITVSEAKETVSTEDVQKDVTEKATYDMITNQITTVSAGNLKKETEAATDEKLSKDDEKPTVKWRTSETVQKKEFKKTAEKDFLTSFTTTEAQLKETLGETTNSFSTGPAATKKGELQVESETTYIKRVSTTTIFEPETVGKNYSVETFVPTQQPYDRFTTLPAAIVSADKHFSNKTVSATKSLITKAPVSSSSSEELQQVVIKYV